MNEQKIERIKRRGATILFVVFLMTLSRPLWADVRIASKVSVSGGNNKTVSPGEQTITTLFKGKKVRQESSEGTVTIFDPSADQVYTLDSKTKTYYVNSVKESLKVNVASLQRKNVKIQLSTSLDTTTGNSRTVAGKETVPCALTVKATAHAEGVGRLFGGAKREFTLLSGNVWAVDSKAILPQEWGNEPESMLPLVHLMLPKDTPLSGSVSQVLSQKKQFPMASHVTIQRPQRAENGDEENYSPLEVTMEITTIAPDITLDDTLFRVPTDYRQVSPPAPPTRRTKK